MASELNTKVKRWPGWVLLVLVIERKLRPVEVVT